MQIARLMRVAAITLVTAILLPVVLEVVGHFFIAWAEEHGWYEHPSESVNAVMASVSTIVDSPWFHWIGGAIIGFFTGVQLDTFLRRYHEATALSGGNYETKQFRTDLRKFVLSDLEEAHTDLMGVIHWLINIENANEQTRKSHLIFFLTEATDKGIRSAYPVLRDEAQRMVNMIEVQQHLLLYMRIHRDAQKCVSVFSDATGIDPDRDKLLSKLLDADKRCLLAFRGIRASSSTADSLRSVPEDLFAAASTWRR